MKNNIKLVRNNLKYSELIKYYFELVSPITQERYRKFLNDYVEMLARILGGYMSDEHLRFDPLLASKFFIHNMNYHYKWIPVDWDEEKIISFFKEKLFFGATGNTIQ